MVTPCTRSANTRVTDLVVFGADGQVGRALCEAADANVAGYDRKATADITNAESVTRTVAGTGTVVNAAAFTNVDGAENIARACAKTDKPLIHISIN